MRKLSSLLVLVVAARRNINSRADYLYRFLLSQLVDKPWTWLKMNDVVLPWNTSFMVAGLQPMLVSGFIEPLHLVRLRNISI
jgi:hypothetical protein